MSNDFEKYTVVILKNEGIDLEQKGQGAMFMIKIAEMIGAIDEDIDI